MSSLPTGETKGDGDRGVFGLSHVILTKNYLIALFLRDDKTLKGQSSQVWSDALSNGYQ